MKLKKSFLSCLLAFLLASAALTPPARAQGGPVTPPTPGKVDPNSSLFIISRNEAGETVCRVATGAERRQMLGGGIEGGATRVIYPGGSRVGDDAKGGSQAWVTTTEAGAELLSSAGLRIVLNATTQLQNNAVAREAFITAAKRWEAIISTPITVVLDVDFGPDFFGQPWSSENVLGATSSIETNRRYSTVRQQLRTYVPEAAEQALYNALPETAVPFELEGETGSTRSVRLTRPLARALGLAPDITNPDAIPLRSGDAGIGFNNAHQFDFNPADGIEPGKLDFDAVVVHEIGHALGFVSESGNKTIRPVTLLDLFRFRPGAASAGNLDTLASAPRVMSEGGAQVFFSNRLSSFGSNELHLSTGGDDGEGGDGEQSSHWRDNRFGPFIGIMDPSLPSGRREVIGDNDRLAFDTFGYKFGSTPAPPPPPAPVTPPANDNFSSALVLPGHLGTVSGDNFDATAQGGEPDPSGDPVDGQRSVWYVWTAPASGPVTMDTVGSDYDTTLGAYVGNALGGLSPAGPGAENDDIPNSGTVSSRISFAATAGTTYRIMVNGWRSETGGFKLNWSGAAPPTAIQFAAPTLNALERDGVLSVLLTRTGDLNAPHSVTFQALAETATPGADFAAGAANIDFPPGVDRVVVPVGILNDAVAELDETVLFQITGSPSGAALGDIRAARLTIRDDDNFPANSVSIAGAAVRSVAEGAGKVDITVTRAGNLSQAAEVAYRTADGTATSLKDYIFASGALKFGVGESSRTFSVLITEDFHDEPEERFKVELSVPIDTALGAAQTSVEVAIQDDDAAGLTTNPSDTAGDFVEQHYNDFLNRVADAGGLGFWSAGITECGQSVDCRTLKRVDTSAAFFLSIEFQETGYLVYRMYKAAYGDIPGAPVPVEFAEFMRDTQELGRGVVVGAPGWPDTLAANKEAFALAFIQRSRFKEAYPAGLTPTQFVDVLNQNAGGVLDAGERQARINELSANDTAAGRAAALRRVAEDQTLRDAEFRKAFVLMQYFGYLRRDPNRGQDTNFNGFFFWLGKLNDNGGDFRRAEMVRAFIESIEYRQRFGQ